MMRFYDSAPSDSRPLGSNPCQTLHAPVSAAAAAAAFSNRSPSTPWTFKEEPVDSEQHDLVIDLTADATSTPSSSSSSCSNNSMSTQYSINTLHPPHHQHQQYPFMDNIPRQSPSPLGDGSGGCGQAVRSESLGNIPSHLQSGSTYSDDLEAASGQDALSPPPAPTGNNNSEVVTGTFKFSVPKNSLVGAQARAKREFVPDNKKDAIYWNKRHKNNMSARLSRMKRKTMEQFMEQRLLKLERENFCLKRELTALKKMMGDNVGDMDVDLASALAEASPLPSSPSSSGLGTSASSLSSSSGSADNSNSSSPVMVSSADDDKAANTANMLSSQVEDTLSPTREAEDSMEEQEIAQRDGADQQHQHQHQLQHQQQYESQFYGMPIGGRVESAAFPPPPAHRQPCRFGSFPGDRISTFTPPAAHSSYPHPVTTTTTTTTSSYPMVQNTPSTQAASMASSSSWPYTVASDASVNPQSSAGASSTLPSASAFAPHHQLGREGYAYIHNRHARTFSGGSSESSPVPYSSSSSGANASEDDSCSSGSMSTDPLRKSSSVSDPDDEIMERMCRVPLKHRMKMRNK